ncbi:MAG: hypothetical protein HW421_2668 [Ignavibacteria bacterium]|nr:hypothetical protein [Ignavibacteria bacterium]
MKISLRTRLAFWYTAIVALSLLAFGAYTYYSVSNELYSNLDASLVKVTNSIDYIIERKLWELQEKQSNGTTHSQRKFKIDSNYNELSFLTEEQKRSLDLEKKYDSKRSNEQESIWSSIYEHILLRPRNYFIQIADTANKIVWRSANLLSDSLPILPTTSMISQFVNKSLERLTLDLGSNVLYAREFSGTPGDSTFFSYLFHKKNVRLFAKRTQNATLSIGYSYDEISHTLKGLFNLLLLTIPLILFVSTLGGLVLSKLSLQSIDEITRTAHEITASNLSQRLSVPDTKDEVGRLKTTLNEMIERLENSFTQIKQFTSDASHEMKTPLTILRGELELALHHQKTPDEYEFILASSLEEVSRLTNIVESLLELSRADAGQVKMNFQKQDIVPLLKDIIEDAEILAESKNLIITTKIDDSVECTIDAPRLHQAFLNIIENAIKYTPANGKINIELSEDNFFTEIKVSDTGIGIPAEQLPHIFDRFYRANRDKTEGITGSGLGLSIVKWIIDAHQGKIFVDSRLQQGTVFTVLLPKVINQG